MIGILGGTFDPVHNGHLKPALDVMQQCELDEMRFIPNATPPHREAPWLSAAQRLELLSLALAQYPDFVVDQRELKRGGTSYMVETLESLKVEYPHEIFCLVMGVDAFAAFDSWHRWQSIPTLAHLVITSRPVDENVEHILSDFGLASNLVKDHHRLSEQDSGKILIQSVTQLDISSTMIRQKLAREQSIRDLVPESVGSKLEMYAD